ncbi:MAG TPA: YihY/virulence factor BrkB family protein [Longimicrobiales bacterium]|nr:YihY/virulence factor BrkB family protein [Longimicrobiales bacterium]
MNALRSGARFVRDLVGDFLGDDCPRMAAALSYYTVFAVPPLLGLLALLASRFVDPEQLQALIVEQVESVVGVDSAAQIVEVVQGVVRPRFDGPTAVLALLALVFGATGAFVQLQDALNAAWGVRPDPRRGDVLTFLVKRGVSLLMILSFGVLLFASVLASTAISVVRGFLSDVAPPWMLGVGLPLADLGISLLAVTVLFTLVLRYVPDAVVRWRDALVGGILTGLLFTAGKLLIGYYLARSQPGSVYGAAGSLVIGLIWIYYSAIILLLGAEFTGAWACRHGEEVTPQRGAVRVRRQVVYADGTDRGQDVRAA